MMSWLGPWLSVVRVVSAVLAFEVVVLFEATRRSMRLVDGRRRSREGVKVPDEKLPPFEPPKIWGINTWRDIPDAGGRKVVEVVVYGYVFPFRIWGTGKG